MRVINRRDSLFTGYTRVLIQELIQSFAAFQILNQNFERNASAAKNRFATENVLVAYDCALHLRLLSAYLLRAAKYTFHGSQ
jgi:hypothetical protein